MVVNTKYSILVNTKYDAMYHTWIYNFRNHVSSSEKRQLAQGKM